MGSQIDGLIQEEGHIYNSEIYKLPPAAILNCSKSICKIVAGSQISTGFLIKFFKGQTDFFCLMTNQHIVKQELIDKRETITFYYNNESSIKEIKLNPEERFIKIFSDIDLDITIIEILPQDNIDNHFFLLPIIEDSSRVKELLDKEITIIQYPFGADMSFSYGSIKEINDNEFTHNASTQQGSSGSPMFLKGSTKVIGIHKSGKIDNSENYGDFIGPVFDFIKNEFKYKKIIDIKRKIILSNGDYYIGELKGNKKHGKGAIYQKDGKIIYEGDFFDDKFNGKGKYFWNNGEKYEGDYNNGLCHGKGIIYYSDGNIKYEGDFVNDKREGRGKYIYKNGEYYIGEWKKNFRHGKGIIYYKNGEIRFEGNFKKNKAEGHGRYIDESGEYYIGEFKHDSFNGKGVQYHKDGKVKYEGNFINDKFEGKGKLFFDNGEYYIGEFKNGLQHGKGKMYYSNGNIKYEGDFINDKFEGNGKYIYENGEYYIGGWKENLRQRKGIIYDKDGNIKLQGLFIDDIYEGNI